jgi:hypothetical protein
MSITETVRDRPRPPLGVGRILKETVLLVWAWKSRIAVLGLIPLLALNIVRYLLAPEQFTGAPTDGTRASYAISTLAFVIIFPVYSIVDGLVARLAYAASTDGEVGVRDCFWSTVPVLMPLMICGSALTLGYIVGLIAFVIPGLFMLSVWLVLVPCIVLDNAGYHCFERSARLTKGYRWPCLAIAVVFVIADISVAYLMIWPLEPLIMSDRFVDKAIYLAADATLSIVSLALFAVASTLTYLRLRDIREGTVWLADVFD